MKKLMVIGLILFLSLSIGNVVPVIAQEGLCGRRREEEGRRGGRERPGFEPVTQEEEKRILLYLEKNRPEKLERLMRLKERSPLKYQRILERIKRKIKGRHFLKDLKEEDPERYEKVVRIKGLKQESYQLARKYREADDTEEKETIRANLSDLLSEFFNLRQRKQESEIERLRKELERLQEKITRRRENKEAIIYRRLKEMTDEADYLWW